MPPMRRKGDKDGADVWLGRRVNDFWTMWSRLTLARLLHLGVDTFGLEDARSAADHRGDRHAGRATDRRRRLLAAQRRPDTLQHLDPRRQREFARLDLDGEHVGEGGALLVGEVDRHGESVMELGEPLLQDGAPLVPILEHRQHVLILDAVAVAADDGEQFGLGAQPLERLVDFAIDRFLMLGHAGLTPTAHWRHSGGGGLTPSTHRRAPQVSSGDIILN
jgi:hypothetical protein